MRRYLGCIPWAYSEKTVMHYFKEQIFSSVCFFMLLFQIRENVQHLPDERKIQDVYFLFNGVGDSFFFEKVDDVFYLAMLGIYNCNVREFCPKDSFRRVLGL